MIAGEKVDCWIVLLIDEYIIIITLHYVYNTILAEIVVLDTLTEHLAGRAKPNTPVRQTGKQKNIYVTLNNSYEFTDE